MSYIDDIKCHPIDTITQYSSIRNCEIPQECRHDGLVAGVTVTLLF